MPDVAPVTSAVRPSTRASVVMGRSRGGSSPSGSRCARSVLARVRAGLSHEVYERATKGASQASQMKRDGRAHGRDPSLLSMAERRPDTITGWRQVRPPMAGEPRSFSGTYSALGSPDLRRVEDGDVTVAPTTYDEDLPSHRSVAVWSRRASASEPAGLNCAQGTRGLLSVKHWAYDPSPGARASVPLSEPASARASWWR